MTATQWEALLEASKTGCSWFHRKTILSLTRRELLTYTSTGYAPTIKGRNLLHQRFAAGLIGPRGGDDGRS